MPIVVVGAGLAGLCCARELVRHGRDVVVLEAADAVGGRIRTDRVDGFLCDRGFQVFLTAYPEAKRQLDYEALDLGEFTSGSLIFNGDSIHRFADPWREPGYAMQSLMAPIGTKLDRVRLARLRTDAVRKCRQPLTQLADQSAIWDLESRGFSQEMIDRFFRPFLGGIFLDRELKTSSRMLHFVFGMFAQGKAALPAEGMEAIPRQLAAGLPEDAVRLNTSLGSVSAGRCVLADGQSIEASHVVLATDAGAAAKLLPSLAAPEQGPSTTVLYFTHQRDPIDEPTLVLNGSGRGRVNTVANLAAASPGYSPNGQPLFSVSLLGVAQESDEELAQAIQMELVAWFGQETLDWAFLKRTTVRSALPNQSAEQSMPLGVLQQDGITICGDWRGFGSIHHAMVSGREAAAAVLSR